MEIIIAKIFVLIWLTATSNFWGAITIQTIKDGDRVLAVVPAVFSTLCVGATGYIWS